MIDTEIATLSTEEKRRLLAQLLQQEAHGPSRPPIEPVGRHRDLPLSFAQERLWFVDRMSRSERAPGEAPTGRSAYDVVLAVRMSGAFRIPVLLASLAEIVRRHEVLRTTLTEVDGQPVQVIAASFELEHSTVELSGLEEAAREKHLHALSAAEGACPFDLERGPLLRILMLRASVEEHVVILRMHHVISDGWSVNVLVRELVTLYTAFAEGRCSPLPPLRVQYADFAVWQREWIRAELLESELAWWQAELRGAPQVLELPADRPRPPVQTTQGASESIRLPARLTRELRGLSHRQGNTLFMTLLAAFEALMSRYSGQEELLVGTPVANRSHPEIEGLIGFFVNTLVMRGDLRGNPSFIELLGRVRESNLRAQDHQEVPFEKLVEGLRPERDLSRSPLFQVMFLLRNPPRAELLLPGLTLSFPEVEVSTSTFDLTLALARSEVAVWGELEYNTDLFDVCTAKTSAPAFPDVPGRGRGTTESAVGIGGASERR